MKLIRCGEPGREKPGLQLDNGARKDLSADFPDWDEKFFASGGADYLRSWLKDRDLLRLPEINAAARTGPPIARPGKIVGIGLNYRDHAAETGAKLPVEPPIFLKATTSFCGPNDALLLPPGALKVDWEVELGVVIGRTARRLADDAAASACIAGYCTVDDVSERSYQIERGGQWDKGKGCDSFCPVGPWLVTPEEVGDVSKLSLTLKVNGEKRQRGKAADMVHTPAALVRYVSQFMTLEPGDLITTGTPAGVGMGMKPPLFLKAGDIVEAEVERLGRQRQVCVQST